MMRSITLTILTATILLTLSACSKPVDYGTALRIDPLQSEEQAAIIGNLLGCDAICVPAITVYDPYDPPKIGASLHLFRRTNVLNHGVDPRELVRRASPRANDPAPARSNFVQVVGMFDAANGSTRAAPLLYAQGRNDPAGPYGARGYLIEMDRYSGFVHHSPIEELLLKPALADAR